MLLLCSLHLDNVLDYSFTSVTKDVTSCCHNHNCYTDECGFESATGSRHVEEFVVFDGVGDIIIMINIIISNFFTIIFYYISFTVISYVW